MDFQIGPVARSMLAGRFELADLRICDHGLPFPFAKRAKQTKKVSAEFHFFPSFLGVVENGRQRPSQNRERREISELKGSYQSAANEREREQTINLQNASPRLSGALGSRRPFGDRRRAALAIRNRPVDHRQEQRPAVCPEGQPSCSARRSRGAFPDPESDLSPAHATTDANHGRIEVRRHHVTHDIDWLFSDRRDTDEPRLPGLQTIAMVEAEVERDGKITVNRRFSVSSTRRTPDRVPGSRRQPRRQGRVLHRRRRPWACKSR